MASGAAGSAGAEGHTPEQRRIRILALHGSASNSNILKFQLSHLRRLLGREAEWFTPDGPEPWEPKPPSEEVVDPVMKLIFQERSPFEQRIAAGKPFVSWYAVDVFSGHTSPNPASVAYAGEWLKNYIREQGPFDVVITFSQASSVVDLASMALVAEGQAMPWSLNIFFCASPTMGGLAAHGKCKVPCLMVMSSDDGWLGMYFWQYKDHFEDVRVLEHMDGHAFPVTQPRASEIYAELAEEVRRHCDVSRREKTPKKPRGGAWLARLAQAQAQARAQPGVAEEEAGADSGSEAVDDGPVAIAPISAEELAALLEGRRCAVLCASAVSRSAPGLRTDLDLRTLRMLPSEAWPRLEQLRADGLSLVVTSLSGGSCEEYCSLLVRQFRWEADRLRLMRGGLYEWDSWEVDNPEAACRIRGHYGLPALPGADVASVTPEELAEMMREERCFVADAREAAETRQRPFPGAARGLGLLSLHSKPEPARRKFQELRGDDRWIVAISLTGGRCRRYCAALAGRFGVDAGRLRWLHGGLLAWEAWETEHRDAADALRAARGLPPSRGRAIARLAEEHASARERSMELLPT